MNWAELAMAWAALTMVWVRMTVGLPWSWLNVVCKCCVLVCACRSLGSTWVCLDFGTATLGLGSQRPGMATGSARRGLFSLCAVVAVVRFGCRPL